MLSLLLLLLLQVAEEREALGLHHSCLLLQPSAAGCLQKPLLSPGRRYSPGAAALFRSGLRAMGYRVVGRMKLQTVIGMLEANKQTNKAEGGKGSP